jgi:hypothetical protein
MSVEIIILGMAILVGLFLFRITKPKFVKGILIGLIVCIILALFQIKFLSNISFVGFGILSLIYSVYSLINKNWRNLVIGFFAFTSFLFGMLHWRYGTELQLSMLIPIMIYIATLTKWREFKSELSVLTIFVAYEILIFLTLAKQCIN